MIPHELFNLPEVSIHVTCIELCYLNVLQRLQTLCICLCSSQCLESFLFLSSYVWLALTLPSVPNLEIVSSKEPFPIPVSENHLYLVPQNGE